MFITNDVHKEDRGHTAIIRINAVAFIKILALKMRCLFEGGVNSREAFITNLVTTTVNLCHLKINLTTVLRIAEVLERERSSKAMKYSHFEVNNITIEKNKFPRLV